MGARADIHLFVDATGKPPLFEPLSEIKAARAILLHDERGQGLNRHGSQVLSGPKPHCDAAFIQLSVTHHEHVWNLL